MSKKMAKRKSVVFGRSSATGQFTDYIVVSKTGVAKRDAATLVASGHVQSQIREVSELKKSKD